MRVVVKRYSPSQGLLHAILLSLACDNFDLLVIGETFKSLVIFDVIGIVRR
jgi:hypothetical protein